MVLKTCQNWQKTGYHRFMLGSESKHGSWKLLENNDSRMMSKAVDRRDKM